MISEMEVGSYKPLLQGAKLYIHWRGGSLIEMTGVPVGNFQKMPKWIFTPKG